MSTDHNYDNRASNPVYHVVWGVRFFFGDANARPQSGFAQPLTDPDAADAGLAGGLIFGAAWTVGQLIGDAVRVEIRIVAQVLMFLLTFLIAYFLYLPVARVLLALFAEALSRKNTSISTGRKIRQNDQGWTRAMWEGLKLVIFQAVVALAALALGLAFARRSARRKWSVAIFLAGLDFFDIPLSTRGLRLRKKLGVIWRNKSLAIGAAPLI